MAQIILNKNAESFASPNWGGSGIASGDDLIINQPIGVVTSGLDQSGLTEGVDSLRILPTCTSGRIGANGASLQVDADIDADSYISNHGGVELFLQASGDDNLIQNFDCGGQSRNWLVGGTFNNITVSGGVLNVQAATVLENNFVTIGGQGTIEYNPSGNALDFARFVGGTWVLKRIPEETIIEGNAVVVFDPDPAASVTSKIIRIRGNGRVVWQAGAIPTVDGIGGTIDFSKARVPFVPGGTAGTVFGTRVIKSELVDTSNLVPLYASQVADGPIPLP